MPPGVLENSGRQGVAKGLELVPPRGPGASLFSAGAAVPRAALSGAACLALALAGCAGPVAVEKMEVLVIDESNKVVDLNGGWVNGGKATEVLIRPRKGRPPENIVIRNCKLRGSIRVMGLGRNGEAEGVRQSSRSLGHTERAQAAAPRNILLSNIEFEARGRVPLYVAPGATRVRVEGCKFVGTSVSTVIYLDAESAQNAIVGNVFETGARREVIAVDGSARNLISRNAFNRAARGGVYLYRNCGEGGTVRHQTPSGNIIENNRFDLKGLSSGAYGVWLGSRNGRSSFRDADRGYDFGSSIDDRDFADQNRVLHNTFLGSARTVRDEGSENVTEPGK